MGEKPKIIIPKLRENSSAIDRAYFFEMCKRVFADYDSNSIELASKRLWQFVTDYTWLKCMVKFGLLFVTINRIALFSQKSIMALQNINKYKRELL